MPVVPTSIPAIRGALKFYRIASIITGIMLLLLVAEMVVKYGLGHELFLGGSGGVLWFAPMIEGVDGLESAGDGANLSLGILVAHGWFYVVYLFACFRVWSVMRWPLWRFLLLASGGIVPGLSFVMEVRVSREVQGRLEQRERESVR